jgi:hypothetical protein
VGVVGPRGGGEGVAATGGGLGISITVKVMTSLADSPVCVVTLRSHVYELGGMRTSGILASSNTLL